MINERVPSYYESEARGYAADKNFNYFYNTPTIDIEHRKYGTDQYMQTVDGKDIKYKQQIVNEFAYIDSLITDKKDNKNHIMNVSTAMGTIETFEYNHPTYDLVQIKIYEQKSGKETHYATLYVDKDYAEGGNLCLIDDYQGVFAKYYSESLKAIEEKVKGQLGKELFNTNKNWKVEFIYDEVERVYIQFKNIKGNSIFIKDPTVKDGEPVRYIGEITAKIPKREAYTYTATDLGNNNSFKLVKYTERTDGFEHDHVKDLSSTYMQDIASPKTVTVEPNTGNRYIIFYYMTGKIITVEYKDIETGEDLKPDYITEITTSGLKLDIPDIPLYVPESFKHDPDVDITQELTDISGDFILIGENEEEIPISNPHDTNHHVIIYYRAQESLKVEYRDLDENPIPAPPNYVTEEIMGIPDEGVRVVVPEIPGYNLVHYKYNPEYNGTDENIDGPEREVIAGGISVPHIPGKNQHIIIYYEKQPADSKVIVYFKEEVPGEPDIKTPVEMEIPSGIETPIEVPDIPEFTPTGEYTKDGVPDLPIPEDGPIKVTPEPDQTIEIIIWYKRGEPEIPETPPAQTPDDNKEWAILKANAKGSEEYLVETSIPTSEDLYVEGELYDYRLVTDIEPVGLEEVITVVIRQPYYDVLEDESGKSQKKYISVEIKDRAIPYNYYQINKVELYDLKSLEVKNDAIKFYDNYDYATNTRGHYVEGEANYKAEKNIPYLEYNLPVGVGTDDASRIQIRSTGGYTVEKIGDKKFQITINDVDYYDGTKIAAGKYATEVKNQLTNEAMAIIEKCTRIKVQTLIVHQEGKHDLPILTGETYYLPEKTAAMESYDYYIPYVAGRAPLYSFYHEKDLYVREEAKNENYHTAIEGNYRLIELINSADAVIHSITNGDRKHFGEIVASTLRIHTPITNDVSLELSTENKKANQIENSNSVPEKGAEVTTKPYVLNLEEMFTIKIPNEGEHITAQGYKNNIYNHGGLTANGAETVDTGDVNTSRVQKKSKNELATPGIIKNTTVDAETNEKEYKVDKSKMDTDPDSDEGDQYAIGPAFAEYKLIRFPYDVYLTNADKDKYSSPTSPDKGEPQLFRANEWYNLYEFVKPNVTEYEFVVPIWVRDAKSYLDDEGIHVLLVAENCPVDTLEAALKDPLGEVKDDTKNIREEYILRKSFNTYISGRLYDLQVRDTDDNGFMGKVQLLPGKEGDKFRIDEMPIGQQGQVRAYNWGLKLGYRFYFDLKTKGLSNKEINIQPNIYYVSEDGTEIRNIKATDPNKKITLFYHAVGSKFKELHANDLNVKMIMANTHGLANNPAFTPETIAATQVAAKEGIRRDFRSQVVIGSLWNGLKLVKQSQKLPYDNILEVAQACGFVGTNDDVIKNKLKSSAIAAATDLNKGAVYINDAKKITKITDENEIKNATGHWYGEYYLPASTMVYRGTVTQDQAIKGAVKPITKGYLVVVFEKITTEDDQDSMAGYLTYSKPSDPQPQQWEQEGIETSIKLPNIKLPDGKNVEITTPNLTNAAAMAIYQVDMRANNDYEVQGTH